MKTIPVEIIALVISFLPSISVTNRPFRTEFRPCVDNSDCANLGHTYACFLYMCYPWENSKSSDHPKCDNDNDCWGGEGKCKFDESSRLTNSGVCFREIISCREDQDCIASKYNLTHCCRNHCCPAEYHHAWREFSCHSHVSCRQLRTGSHCCDKDGEIINDFIDVKSNPSDKRRCCFNHQNKAISTPQEKYQTISQVSKKILEKGAGTEVLNVIELNSKPHNFTSQDVVSVNLVSSTTTKQIVENRSTNENQLERSTFPGLESPSSQMDGELIGAGSGYSEVENSPVILTNTEDVTRNSVLDDVSRTEVQLFLDESANEAKEHRYGERVTMNTIYYYFLIILTIVIYLSILMTIFVWVRLCYYRRCMNQTRTVLEIG